MAKLLEKKIQLMGIVNVNDDSFCDDGSLDHKEIAHQAIDLINAGADIIDVGAESARTNRGVIPVEEEVRRLKLFLEQWQEVLSRSEARDELQSWPPKLSLNTWRSEVVERVLPMGVDILNDMSGLPTARNAELAAQHEAQLLLMHLVGQPKVAHRDKEWEDVLAAVMEFFQKKIKMAGEAGLPKEALILDPGIDFAKQCEHNLKLYANLDVLCSLGCRVLLPISRKTVIGDVLEISDPKERDAGTLACLVNGILGGATLFRVHNVRAAFDATRMMQHVLS